ncbi:signal peptidase I [Cyphellophora europaea CBS 101466]|uniref:Mitochondrial inner membrane protease subunit n=1 Tax=Cyphellophora europaea (strain CBS 101466) TaxID=1220924 RepID=W2SAH4_CYPE1|nr:signal peptidase I [Cyphellophora europaea CBS 101466]ETN45023.1 signal peptidase I [Cyphellophora europaea CBS 101466]
MPSLPPRLPSSSTRTSQPRAAPASKPRPAGSLPPITLRTISRALTKRIPSPFPWATLGRGALVVLSIYSSFALFTRYILEVPRNEGPSMMPTIPASNALTVISRWYSHGRGIKLGDIVQASNPVFKDQMVGKRVVGMPGDYVLRDEAMAATAGGAFVPGFGDGREGKEERREPVMVQVPEGHVWLAGDNMAWSRDSRFYGPVPLAMIKAKTLWVLPGLFTWEGVWREQMRKVDEVEDV